MSAADPNPYQHARDLADYRSRVTALYLAEPTAGEPGWQAFRAGRDALLREHPQSPLEPADQAGFTGLRYFDYDPSYRLRTVVRPVSDDEEFAIDTGGVDGVLRYRRVGRLDTPLGGLTLFWLTGYGGGLFLPFRDTTAPELTYGGGRYLTDTIKGTFGRGLALAGSDAIVDFNYAYNPSCAYNSRYACPLAPAENRLDLPVPAGELRFHSTAL